jgi:type IV pilus biogenesis protein CpaD/CtpE
MGTTAASTRPAFDLAAVSRVLDMEQGRIKRFIDYHPEPSTDALVAAADTELDGQERERVAAWLDQYLDTDDVDPSPAIGGDPAGLRGLTW